MNEVNMFSLENRLAALTSSVEKLAADSGVVQQQNSRGIRRNLGHPTARYQFVQEYPREQFNTIGSFHPQLHHSPYSNAYNSEWYNYPNYIDENTVQQQPSPWTWQQQESMVSFGQNIARPTTSSGTSLEDQIANLTNSVKKMQRDNVKRQEAERQCAEATMTSFKELSNQITQFNNLISNQGKASSQVWVNPMEDVIQMMLRSGQKLEEPTAMARAEEQISELTPFAHTAEEQISEFTPFDHTAEEQISEPASFDHTTTGQQAEVSPKLKLLIPEFKVPPPFPNRLKKNAKVEDLDDILTIFDEVEIADAFLEAIRTMPKCASFEKDFLAKKNQHPKEEMVVECDDMPIVLEDTLPCECTEPNFEVKELEDEEIMDDFEVKELEDEEIMDETQSIHAIQVFPRNSEGSRLPERAPAETIFPILLQVPVLQLRSLDKHLKSMFLSEEKMLPTIKNNNLPQSSWIKLIWYQRRDKEAGGKALICIQDVPSPRPPPEPPPMIYCVRHIFGLV